MRSTATVLGLERKGRQSKPRRRNINILSRSSTFPKYQRKKSYPGRFPISIKINLPSTRLTSCINSIIFRTCHSKNIATCFRRTNVTRFHLPPHFYANGLKQHMIETRVKKKIGTRGPYDTFTGPRDSGTGKKCYFLSDNWPLPLECYKSHNCNRTYTNVFKSVFIPIRKVKRYVPEFSCVEMPNWLPKKKNKYPFNSTQKIGSRPKFNEYLYYPGPNRYKTHLFKRSVVNGHTNVFKSTAAQRMEIARKGHGGVFD
ncbi:uncharacterized protein LOC113560367 [Rhopalosiphum maidis]|uniref:uncharacterized protein LOC113560367 n=1 Tax=Rhopalosiphum maidis TaxID=43146 RepID=UPI000EFF6714|nr:uncharacterized protein LOC113560367 [Rhopalosiphum maidis]